MKACIITVYEPTNNIGSYLQAYAMKTALEDLGFEVYFAEKVPSISAVASHVLKINPKRALFLRIKQGFHSLSALSKLKKVKYNRISNENFDVIVYGSDEIWNLENSYFADGLFWGKGVGNAKKIAYGISCGAMSDETFHSNLNYASELASFSKILVRDEHTYNLIAGYLGHSLEYVCDPTFLVPVNKLQKDKKILNEKYLLVYSYGIDEEQQNWIIKFAREKNLKIVSAHFWHHWCDKCIAINPLEFGSVISGAEYVFTSTFHGAVFTMLNHKKCAILPVREKVSDVVRRMGAEKHLVSFDSSYDAFKTTIEQDFDDVDFESILDKYRSNSMNLLKEAIQCEK